MSKEQELTTEEWKPENNPWIVSFPVILAAFMFVLDGTIANVALPHMAGTFSISRDESLWILTSYLVASGVVIPAVDYFTKLFGRKVYFILSILLFTFASVMCACSKSIAMMLIARIIQGVGGGGLLPVSQAVLMESFPVEKRGKAMAAFGVVIVVAPIIGPVLGGWITDNFDWTWVFLINLPIGLITAYIAYLLLEEPPYARKQENIVFDAKGFLFLLIWFVSLQVILDKGNNQDWFNSPFVCRLTLIMVISGILFFWSQFVNKNSLIDLSVFKDKNFVIGTVIQIIIQAVLLASIAILPQFLQSLMGYTAFLSGLTIMPRGMGACVSLAICGSLSAKVDNRILAAFGLILVGISGCWLGMLNLQISSFNVVMPNFLYGFGMGFAMVPLVSLSVITLKNSQMTNASGVQNLLKNIGGAIGTSLAGTLISRFSQIHQSYLVDSLNSLNPVYNTKLAAVQAGLSHYVNPVVAAAMAKYSLYAQLLQQSTLWGFMETFRIFGIAALIMFPLVFIIKETGVKKTKKN